MNYYPHHIGDYDSHTAHLSWLEDMAYRRLICLYYRTEKPLPLVEHDVCRLIRAQTPQEKKAVIQVLNEFFIKQSDGWHSTRCNDEINKANIKAERNREVGKKGGRPRKIETTEVNKNNPKITQMVSEINPNITLPITNNQEPIAKDKSSANAPTFDDDEIPVDRQRWIEFFRDECAVDVDAHSTRDRTKFFPLTAQWIKSGISIGQMRKAVSHSYATAKEGFGYLPAYVDRVLATQSKPASDTTETTYQRSIRERVAEIAPGVARKAPGQFNPNFIDEVRDVIAIESH